jgi:hypothetical protein
VTSDRGEILMCRVQDHGKKNGSQYLPLMQLAHKEDPDDAPHRREIWLDLAEMQ